MNVCVPILDDQGMKSEICGHFGSAPLFLIVDTQSATSRAVQNGNLHHGHGMCQPLAAISGERVDAVVVGGIGRGALDRLRSAGIRVFIAGAGTAGEAVSALEAGQLEEVGPAACCGHHGDGPHGRDTGSEGSCCS